MSAVEIAGLRKTFGDVVAIDEVSFSVEPGEIFGILGPNGAGKSTTVECLTGALVPDAGSVHVLGVAPAAHRAVVREKVGYQLQSAVLPAALRVGEAMRLFASFYPNPQPIDELLDAVGLRAHRTRPFGKLSGGQQQRLSIALALVGSPELVVLDELTTGLDPQARREVWALIERVKARGVTVILVSHYLDEVERLCDRLTIIANGRTRFVGTPAELRGDAQTLEDAYVSRLDASDWSELA